MIILFSSFNCTHPFSYDSAIHAAQKGNWQDAHAALNNLITHNPDNAEIMYDAGVTASHLGNHEQAATCFSRAAQSSKDKDICFRSHFNAGNAYVDQKDLKSALTEYNKALAIEPDNEYARHNRDRVKEMLKEEEKQKEKDNQKDKEEDKQENQDQQEKEDKQNNEQNAQENQDKQDGQKQNGDDKQSGNDKQQGDQNKQDDKQDDTSNDGSNKQSQRDQRDNNRNDSKDTERKEQGNKQEQQKNSANDEQRNSKNELDKKTNDAHNKSDKQQGDQHAQSPEKQNNGNDKSSVASAGKQEQVIDDPWLLSVLNNQELQDKAINKQLMEARIRQHGGKNGQNCW